MTDALILTLWLAAGVIAAPIVGRALKRAGFRYAEPGPFDEGMS